MPIVSIKSEKKKFELKQGEVIFEGLDNCGYELPHGCLAGSCGACRIEITSGEENLKPMSEVEKDTVEAIRQNYGRIYGREAAKKKIIRLACRAKIEDGEVEIEPLK